MHDTVFGVLHDDSSLDPFAGPIDFIPFKACIRLKPVPSRALLWACPPHWPITDATQAKNKEEEMPAPATRFWAHSFVWGG